jgi:hypothetical protein
LSRRHSLENQRLQQFVICHFCEFGSLAAGNTRSRF